MTLETVLTGVARLGLDTAPLIYFVEAHPHYDALVIEIFRRIADGELGGVTSVITLTEVLTQPLRQGRADLQAQYRDLLADSANFELISIDPAAAELAADLRARYNLRTPDALQIAVALAAGCQAFLTNDQTLKRVTELQIVILDDLISPPASR
jgi:predicted nucleic acid-binding protein